MPRRRGMSRPKAHPGKGETTTSHFPGKGKKSRGKETKPSAPCSPEGKKPTSSASPSLLKVGSGEILSEAHREGLLKTWNSLSRKQKFDIMDVDPNEIIEILPYSTEMTHKAVKDVNQVVQSPELMGVLRSSFIERVTTLAEEALVLLDEKNMTNLPIVLTILSTFDQKLHIRYYAEMILSEVTWLAIFFLYRSLSILYATLIFPFVLALFTFQIKFLIKWRELVLISFLYDREPREYRKRGSLYSMGSTVICLTGYPWMLGFYLIAGTVDCLRYTSQILGCSFDSSWISTVRTVIIWASHPLLLVSAYRDSWFSLAGVFVIFYFDLMALLFVICTTISVISFHFLSRVVAKCRQFKYGQHTAGIVCLVLLMKIILLVASSFDRRLQDILHGDRSLWSILAPPTILCTAWLWLVALGLAICIAVPDVWIVLLKGKVDIAALVQHALAYCILLLAMIHLLWSALAKRVGANNADETKQAATSE